MPRKLILSSTNIIVQACAIDLYKNMLLYKIICLAIRLTSKMLYFFRVPIAKLLLRRSALMNIFRTELKFAELSQKLSVK